MAATTLHLTAPFGLPVINLRWLLPNKAEIATAARTLKFVALFAAAPFIGLAYAVLLPFVGIAMMAKAGYEACRAAAA